MSGRILTSKEMEWGLYDFILQALTPISCKDTYDVTLGYISERSFSSEVRCNESFPTVISYKVYPYG